MGAVHKGYGADFSTLQYNTPDYNKLANLQQNVYQFSGAKNWHMLRDLTNAITEGNRIRTFSEFQPIATNIIGDYQGHWLRTEYNLAISGAQMASKWVDIEKATKFQSQVMLEYRTQEDERVRDTHRPLNGITLPHNNIFWRTFYPPNGWNCRCTVIRNPDGQQSPQSEINQAQATEIPKIFQTNLGQSGLIYPKNSPYFINCPQSVLDHAETLIQKPKK